MSMYRLGDPKMRAHEERREILRPCHTGPARGAIMLTRRPRKYFNQVSFALPSSVTHKGIFKLVIISNVHVIFLNAWKCLKTMFYL